MKGSKRKILITREDIDLGERSKRRRCAVARAASRHFDQPISVTYTRLWVGSRGIRLNKRMRRWIKRFDRENKNVTPTSFKI